MELIPSDTHIDFLGRRKIGFAISGTLIALSLALLLFHGLNWGIDFRGGTLVQVSFAEATTTRAVQDGVDAVGLGNAQVQSFENSDSEFLLRFDVDAEKPDDAGEFSEQAIDRALAEQFPGITIDRVEMVGPKVGGELKRKGLLSVLWALGGVLLYIWVRFQLHYGVGAILALIHDVIITLGVFSLAGIQVELPIVAAVLTIVGYSLNDTIVVFDRIRENVARKRKAALGPIMNESINETLSRTILTSGTTLIVVVVLALFGGGVIQPFAFALLIGIVVGTYSSIFVASPVVLLWHQRFGDGAAAAPAPAVS